MKNFIQKGDVLTVAAPAGGVSSGDVVLIESLLGVAAFDAAATEDVEIAIEGVFEVPKLSTDDIAVGDTLYWDSDPGEMTLTDTANTKAGIATEAAGAGATVVRVKLTPGAA